MRRVVLVVQVVLGLYFVAVGVMHFVVPDGLPEQMEWMYDLPTWTHWVSGAAEVAGGLGLILPRLTQVRMELEPCSLDLAVVCLRLCVKSTIAAFVLASPPSSCAFHQPLACSAPIEARLATSATKMEAKSSVRAGEKRSGICRQSHLAVASADSKGSLCVSSV